MTKHVVVSQAEPIEDLADVSFRQPVMADYEGWDLQRLGAEFDRLLAGWKALRPAATAAAERFEDELSKRGITPNDKVAFWALEKEMRAPAVKLANDALDALTPVTELIRDVPVLTVQDIAVKLSVLRFEMIGDDEETEPEDQDWDVKCMNQFCNEVQALATQDPHQHLSLLAKEFKETAMLAHPEVDKWTLWEGKGASGFDRVFFALEGLPSGGSAV